MKKFLLIILFFIEITFIFQWKSCTNFPDNFHFSSYDIDLRLIDYIHSDGLQNVYLTRFFHNKPYVIVTDLISRYLLYWNIQFLTQFISLVGVFGMYFGVYSMFKRSGIGKKTIFVILLLGIPGIEMFFYRLVPYSLRLVLLGGSYTLLSQFGLWQYIQKATNKKLILVIILNVISIWWFFVMRNDIVSFCTK